MGKKVSIILCVVVIGSLGYSRSTIRRCNIPCGIGWRTAQRCIMFSSRCSPLARWIRATGSCTLKLPPRIQVNSTGSGSSKGTIILWENAPSVTAPSTCPATSVEPITALGSNFHFFSWSMASTSTPRGRNVPCDAAKAVSGICKPSKTCPNIPGPSTTESISPVNSTRSPTLTPLVSSNTCMSALSPWIRRTSAFRRSSPTRT